MDQENFDNRMDIDSISGFLESKKPALRKKGLELLLSFTPSEGIPFARNLLIDPDMNVRFTARNVLKILEEKARESTTSADLDKSIEMILKEPSAFKATIAFASKKDLKIIFNHLLTQKISPDLAARILEYYFNTEKDFANLALLSEVLYRFYGSSISAKSDNFSSIDETEFIAKKMFFTTKTNIDHIRDSYFSLFLKTTNSLYKITYSALFWNIEKLKITSELKKMVTSNNVEDQELALDIISYLKAPDLKPLLAPMLQSTKVNIKDRASGLMLEFQNIMTHDSKETLVNTALTDESKRRFSETLLTSADSGEKIEILKILYNISDIWWLPKLKELLKKEKDPFVIATLVKTIGFIGRSDSIELLKPFLKNSDARIIANTIEGLTGIDDDNLLKVFEGFLEHNDYRIAATAAKAIWNFNRDKVRTIIEKFCSSNDIWKKKSALYTCKKIEDAAIVDSIRTLITDANKEIAREANDYIVAFESARKDQKDQDDLLDFITQKTEGVPAHFADERIAIIDNELINVQDKVKAITELAFFGTENNVPVLKKILEKVQNPILIAGLVKTIGKIGRNESEFLVKYLDFPDERVRANTVEGLEEQDLSKIKNKVYPLLYEQNNRIRANAIKMLWKFEPDIVFQKVQALCKSPDPESRKSGTYALYSIGTQQAYDELKKLVNDQNINVAVMASELIAKLSGKIKANPFKSDSEEKVESKETSILREMLPQSVEIGLKIQTISKKPVLTIHQEEVLENLRELESTNSEVRRSAMNNLKNITKENDLDIIENHLADCNDNFALASITRIISNFPNNPRTEKILLKFVEMEDLRIKSNAIESLFKINKEHLFEKLLSYYSVNDDRIKYAIFYQYKTNNTFFKYINRYLQDEDYASKYYHYASILSLKFVIEKYGNTLQNTKNKSEVSMKIEKIIDGSGLIELIRDMIFSSDEFTEKSGKKILKMFINRIFE